MAAINVDMPALSSTMKEGKIVQWTVKEGDKVSAGDVIMVVESDKADMDVEAFEDGWFLQHGMDLAALTWCEFIGGMELALAQHCDGVIETYLINHIMLIAQGPSATAMRTHGRGAYPRSPL